MDFGLGRSRGSGQGKHALTIADKNTDFEFLGGSLVGGDRGQGWTGLRAWEE